MIYQFGDFELDTDLRELRNAADVRAVEPQVFALIELLIANADRVIPKDEIIEKIWDGRAISDAAINSRVRLARQAIDDSGKEQRRIKTIHGQGFRFVEKLRRASPDQNAFRDAASPSSVANRPIIAVLPFDNMSDDTAQEHLADGMCEDIITVLSKVPGLTVIARNSSFTYKGRSVDIREAGEALGAQYVLEGSLRRAGDRLRVTGQLIEAANGTHVWAERYDRTLVDIFELQDQLTREIVSALQISLTEGTSARLWSAGTRFFEAWEKQIQSPPLIGTQKKDKVLRGRQLSREAVEIDPEYSEAWASVGLSYFVESLAGWGGTPLECLKNACDALQSALKANEENPLALAGLGVARIMMQDYDGGFELAERGYALAPNSSEVANLYALAGLFCGKIDSLDRLLREALDYFPIYPAWYQNVLGAVHLVRNEVAEAVAAAAESVKIDPDYLHAYTLLAIGNVQLGELEEARNAVANIRRLNPKYTVGFFCMTQPFKDEAARECYAAALKLAGLPK